MISILIFAHNEQKHIERSVKSALSCTDDVTVILSDAKDTTGLIATSLGANVAVIEANFFAEKINKTLDTIDFKYDFLMRLDADEVISPPSVEKLRILFNTHSLPDYYFIKRNLCFCRKQLYFGGVSNRYTLRIWRKGTLRYEARKIDEEPVLGSGVASNLEISIIDDPLLTISEWIEKHNRYSVLEALNHVESDHSEIIAKFSGTSINRVRYLKHLYYKLPSLFRPFLFFIYRYIFQLGFLDGRYGFYFHILHSFWYRFLIEINIQELKRLK